jgi:hypothetical protein
MVSFAGSGDMYPNHASSGAAQFVTWNNAYHILLPIICFETEQNKIDYPHMYLILRISNLLLYLNNVRNLKANR